MAEDSLFDIEIERDEDSLEDLEATLTPTADGGMEITFADPDDVLEVPADFNEHDANIATFLNDMQLASIATLCDSRYQVDFESNSEGFEIITRGMKHLGLTIQELNDPFPGASPVTHPLILEAGLKTQAKIMGEIFNGKGIVDTYLVTDTDAESLNKANRVKNYMDYQYLYQMKEFLPDSERLSFRYSLTGNAYRKYYYDPIQERPRSKYITEDKFIINTNCTTLEDADFHTELVPIDKHDLDHLIELKYYKDIRPDGFEELIPTGDLTPSEVDDQIIIETGDAMGYSSSGNTTDKFQLREYHCYLNLPEPFNDETRRALPYIVTVEEGSNKVLSIRRNWKKTDALRLKRVWYAHYSLIPGLGFHGMGYLHILGNFQFALTQITRSLIDSGQFANLQGGFRAKGVRFSRDSTVPIRFGEFREIDTGSKPIGDVLYPLQFKEPSQVLQQILIWLDGRAQKFADSTEQVIADSTNYGPVGTTVALLEASTKFTNGILKRFYKALGDEFRILHDLNFDVLDETQDFFLKGAKFTVAQEDFGGIVDVIPSADPNLSSSAHRIALAQTKLQAAQQAPEIHNLKEAYMEFYRQIGMEEDEIKKLVPPPEEAQPLDPMSDIIALSQGKPIKAFPGQDHDSHIKFKTAFLGDSQGGQLGVSQAIVPLVEANIAEHAMLRYVERFQGVMANIDPKTIEQFGLEKSMAEAAEIVKTINGVEGLNELANANDPATIMALSEMKHADVRAEELDHKKEMYFAKQVTAQRTLDLKEIDIFLKAKQAATATKAGVDQTRMKVGADMITKSLTDLGDRSGDNSGRDKKGR